MVKCIDCDKPATCTRHTQFAGDHPYCDEHGMMQEDYFVDDSYTYWTKAADLMSDKGYELATHEEAEAFQKQRDYGP